VEDRSSNIDSNDGNSIYRIRIALWSDVIVGSYGDNQPVFSDSLDRTKSGGINLGWFFGRSSNIE
jgi:hypothetical protein